jgi:D-glycero-alpha-D-manno-heptose-7-phosphate kinase
MSFENSLISRAHVRRETCSRPLYRARTPVRISFAGGGTDVYPFPEAEGGVVLSATINRFSHGLLRPREDDRITVESHDLGVTLEYSAHDIPEMDGRLDLVKAVIARIADQLGERRGVDVYLRSWAPAGSGLGGSSSLVVTLIGLLRDFHRLALTDYETARLAWEIERLDLGLAGGLQDQYASTFGGFNFIEFSRDGVLVNPLRVHRDVVLELEENMVLCFTGSTREGANIIDDQTSRYEAEDEDTIGALRMQKELAVEMKAAILQARLNTFGELLDVAWEHKKRFSPKVTTPRIDEIYACAREAGALGGKVTGAGGGGFMIFYCASGTRPRVVERLSAMGLKESDFAFEPAGLTTWSYVEHD